MKPYYLLRNARGAVVGGDAVLDDTLKEYADKIGAVIYDYANNQVYPELEDQS